MQDERSVDLTSRGYSMFCGAREYLFATAIHVNFTDSNFEAIVSVHRVDTMLALSYCIAGMFPVATKVCIQPLLFLSMINRGSRSV